MMGNLCTSHHTDLIRSINKESVTPFSFTKNSTTIGSFSIKKVLACGSFGKILLVEKIDTGKIYAMKVVHKKHLDSPKKKSRAISEREILVHIQSPFIVKIHYAFQTAKKLCLVLDYFAGRDLGFHIKETTRLAENSARFYAAEVLLALEDLHNNKIIYRDLKPENVLMCDDGHICLADFNLSKKKNNLDITDTICGTPEYISPEVLLGNPQGPEVDFWGLGILIYEMMNGSPPYVSENRDEMYKLIIQSKLKFLHIISFDAQDITKKLLNPNPKRRLADFELVKQHPFFSGINWKDMRNKAAFPPQIPNLSAVETRYSTESSELEPQLESYFKNFTYSESLV